MSMEDETIIYYEPDPVVSAVNELKTEMRQELTVCNNEIKAIHQDMVMYNIAFNLWTVMLLSVLIGIGLVIVFKRK